MKRFSFLPMRRRLLGTWSALIALSSMTVALPASADVYPAKVITFVIPFTPGAAPDVYARSIAREVAREAGVPVVVENKPGAGSVLAAQAVAKAVPDGYTVLITGNVAFTGNPHIMKRMAYDPVKDFTPITTLAKGPMYLYVNPQTLNVNNVAELLEAARKQPQKYTFGYTSITSRLPAEMLQQGTGISLLGVPYKSGVAATPDLLGGQIDMLFTDLAPWTFVTSGKLRAIGVTDLKRSPYATMVPTFEEQGVKGMDISFWLAAYLPANAPPAVAKKLHQLLSKAAKSPDMQTSYQASGTFEFLQPLGALEDFQSKESAAWGKTIRSANIRPE